MTGNQQPTENLILRNKIYYKLLNYNYFVNL